jgi:hypothetical protein
MINKKNSQDAMRSVSEAAGSTAPAAPASAWSPAHTAVSPAAAINAAPRRRRPQVPNSSTVSTV